MVADDLVRTGALDRGEDLHRHASLVDPTGSTRRANHGVFAADVVRGDRHVKPLARPGDDVEVRHGRLDEQRVGPLTQVGLHFRPGLAGVGRVYLMATAVAKRRRRLRGFTEWAVKTG